LNRISILLIRYIITHPDDRLNKNTKELAANHLESLFITTGSFTIPDGEHSFGKAAVLYSQYAITDVLNCIDYRIYALNMEK